MALKLVHNLDSQVEAPTEHTGFYIDPEYLHTVLPACETQTITFTTKRAMQRYRARLYRINHDNIRRYRTMRVDNAMYGILIIRIK